MVRPVVLGLLTALVFTLPSTGQSIVDTTYFDCGGGPPIQNLQKAYLYGYRNGWTRVDSLDVAGMEGLPDSFQVGVPGPYYVTTRNPAGESCASAIVVVGNPTGVDQHHGSYDQVLWLRVFDVRGRLVATFINSEQAPILNTRAWLNHALAGRRLATGIYPYRAKYKSGRIETRKVVVLK